MFRPFSKEDQLKNAPGGNRKSKSNVQKGQKSMDKSINLLCDQLGQVRSPQDRRNNQSVAGGGCNNADISIKALKGWAIEDKDEVKLNIREMWRDHCRDNPAPRAAMIVIDDMKVLMLEATQINRFLQDGVTALGYEVTRRSAEPLPPEG